MDVDRLEKLVRSVNVPSVREEALGGAGAGSVTHVKDADGDDIEVKEVRFFWFYGRASTSINVGHCYVFSYRWSGRSQRILRDDGQRHPDPNPQDRECVVRVVDCLFCL